MGDLSHAAFGCLLAAVLSCPGLPGSVLRATPTPQGQCVNGIIVPPPAGTTLLGSWLPPFDHPSHACWGSTVLPGFNSIHACLIPVDPTRPSNPHGGKVLVWDESGSVPSCADPALNGDYVQRYAIVDPATQSFFLGQFLIPAADAPPAYNPAAAPNGFHGLFCSGHCWLRDGKLLVAGGDDWSDDINVAYSGSQIVCLFDPWAIGNSHWSVLRDSGSQNVMQLQRRRWYPSLARLADDQDTVVIAGGVRRWRLAPPGANWYELPDDGPSTYEAIRTWNPNASPPGPSYNVDSRNGVFINGTPVQGLFSGPALSGGLSLFYYPRLHLTSDQSLNGASPFGLLWSAAFPTESAWVEHVLNPAQTPAQWPGPHATIPINRNLLEEPSTLLLPNSPAIFKDVLATIGGQHGFSHTAGTITDQVWLLDTKLTNPSWTPGPPMHYRRKFNKTVILPDLSLLTVGGGQSPNHGGQQTPPVNDCEVFWPEVYRNGQWQYCAKESFNGQGSRRTYHSCAVLLPSGEVLSCGGNTRDWNYQVFRPHYFDGNPTPPQWSQPPPAATSYGANFNVHFTAPALQSIEKIVLTTPGSWTHAQDTGQRAISLAFEVHDTNTSATVTTPANKTEALPGIYMIWLVSSAGVPSVAQWVKLQ